MRRRQHCYPARVILLQSHVVRAQERWCYLQEANDKKFQDPDQPNCGSLHWRHCCKEWTRAEHAKHLEEAFCLMQAYNMKLNPAKRAFGVSIGKFLGFMVTQRGIEVNLAKVKVILETPIPNNKKELQRLTGHLIALGCFISRFIDKLRPFFLTLRGASTFD